MFESDDAKRKFYRKANNSNHTITVNNETVELWFDNNRTFEERLRDKTLGMMKYNLIEKKSLAKHRVRID